MPHLISRDAGMRKCIKDHSLSCPAQQPAPASTPSEITKELFHMERKNHQTSIWNIDYQQENHFRNVHFAPSFWGFPSKVQSPSTQWDCSARAFQWATGGAPCWNLAMGEGMLHIFRVSPQTTSRKWWCHDVFKALWAHHTHDIAWTFFANTMLVTFDHDSPTNMRCDTCRIIVFLCCFLPNPRQASPCKMAHCHMLDNIWI